MADDPIRIPMLLVISAPSGAGKTTLCQQVLATVPEMTRAVTCTTRAPRPGERPGMDYYFLEVPAFQRRIAAGEFLEHARVYGQYYGTLKSELANRFAAGHDVLLVVDVQGVAHIQEEARKDPALARALVTVFLTPRTLGELAERLNKRGTDTAEIRQQRLEMARQEIAQSAQFDYLLLSTSVAEDLRRMRVIIEAERMRPARTRLPLEETPPAT